MAALSVKGLLVHCFSKFFPIERRGVTSRYHGSTITG